MSRTVVMPINNDLEVDFHLANGPKFVVNKETGRVVAMLVKSSVNSLWGASDGYGGLTGFDYVSERAAMESLDKTKYKVVVDIIIK